MPIGVNLTFNFDTQAVPKPVNQYPFSTEGQSAVAETFEFDVYHGAYADFSLEAIVFYQFPLCEYIDNAPGDNSITMEFVKTCPLVSNVHGHQMFVDFTTIPAKNIAFGLCDYRNNDNNVYIRLEFSPHCTDYSITFGSKCEVVLTAERDLGTRYDLSLCQEVYSYETPVNIKLDKVCDFYQCYQDVGLEISLTATSSPVHHNLYNICYERHHNVTDNNCEFETTGFSVEKIVHTTNMFFDSLEVVKNLNWDLKLCPTEENPPADYSEIEPHLIEHRYDYTYPCGELEFDFYHGQHLYAFVQEYVEFVDLQGFHGHNTESDLLIYQNFSVDQYHGGYGDADMTIFLGTELDIDQYHGHYGEFDLHRFIIFYDADNYHGGYSDSELVVPKGEELTLIFYNGATNDVNIATFPVIYTNSAYHGAYSDADFTSFPSEPVDMEPAYHGATNDVELLVTPHFSVDQYHGHYGEADMELHPSEGVGNTDAYHGGYGDVTMNVTFALYADAYHGHYGDFEISTQLGLEVDFYDGGYGDCDFTQIGPPTFDPNPEHGSYSVLDSLSVTKALFPRAYNGAYSDVSMDISPSEAISIDSYHGAYSVVDELFEDEWNFFNYHGAYAEFDELFEDEWNFFDYEGATAEADLTIFINFGNTDGYHGATMDIGDLNYDFVSLDIDAYFGSSSQTSVYLPPPAEFEPRAYHGQYMETEPHILIYQHLAVRFVHDLAMYDGVAGVGGLNFCPSQNLSGSAKYEEAQVADLDTVVRFPYPKNLNPADYQDHLITRFDDNGFSPFHLCNSHHNNGYMEFELLTRPRFDAEAYVGDNTEVYSEKELTGFGDPPLDLLYSEDGQGGRKDHIDKTHVRDFFTFDMYHGANAIAWWNGEDDFFVWHASEVEFDFIFVGDFDITTCLDTCAYVQDIVAEKGDWTTAFGPWYHGSEIILDFEPVIFFRFCPGYIIPTGSNVILEFNNKDNTDCFIYAATGGEICSCGTFNNHPYPQPRMYGGARMEAILTINPKDYIEARAYHGQHLFMPGEAFLEIRNRHGSVMYATFYEPPIRGYGGEYAEFELAVPGPAVRWETESGCLPNEYVPLTTEGDIDYQALEPDEQGVYYYPHVPVEGLPYYTTLEAVCITYAQSVGD